MLFGRDLPEALETTVAIADRCNVEIPMSGHHLPNFRVPDGHTVDSYFAEVARLGLDERWEMNVRDFPGRKHSLEEYKDRLDHELRVITQMGFPGYFLIVWDFIRFAKEQMIPVGPGRGSAAGSLAAYCLKITDVDPLQYDLLFERFLNPERVSMPDIDIDFCVRGRGEVIKYVSDYYGRDHVSQIITFGTMASKAAIKDVGRALEMPFGEVDRIAKMIPPPIRGRNVSIEDATEMNPDLKKEIERNEQVKQLIDLAKRLEGCSRHASVHAAGVVISPRPIHELVPVYKSSKDEITTQYAMSDLEKTGMLKMDFLALTTLTIIEDCLKTIAAETGSAPDLSKIPLEDPDALKVFADGRTDAIFQFEGCLSGDTQIGGKHHTIRELFDQVQAMKERGEFLTDGRNGTLRLKSCFVDDGKFHSNAVLDVVASGIKPVFRIVTAGNYTIKATADHRFLTERGWVRLGELDPATDRLLFKTDTHYTKRVCADCAEPLRSRVAKVLRCKACAARMTSNPSKPTARAKISEANTGRRPWNVGITHDSDRFGQWQQSIVRGYEKYKGRPIEARIGVERAARIREITSKRNTGRGNPMYGRSHTGPSAYSAAGYREDIGHYVRSSWEADFARVLKFLSLAYEYEPERFTLRRDDGTTMTYAPDFYVPAESCWYEIKGWMDHRSAEKIRLFREQYPDERLFVVDKTQFAELQMKYQGFVRWECPKTPTNTGFVAIRSITSEGEEETFDITMEAPGNNFLANGFVVHNSGMKEICRKLGPEGIDDLAALNALYRPGPIDSGMVDDFIDRRHGRKKVTFDFSALKDILGPTLGIVVFQEQVMALFQRLAGYSLGEADVVRRIMGKKKRDELDKHREKFISAAERNGHDRKKLDKLWQMLEGFADYAFNKSHSVAYALLAYQTAFLKAHYPPHFWAAVLSNELDNTEKVAKYISEIRASGIQVLPPDANISNDLFTPLEGTIRFGLVAIKGLGQSAVSAILDARREGGPFTSMFDFCERVDSRAVNKRVLECLIKSGAFDSFGARRRQLFEAVDSAVESGARAQRDRATGQVGLFAVMTGAADEPPPPLPDVEEWSAMEILTGEKETLGFYITGHPLARYKETLDEFASSTVEGLESVPPSDTVRVGGVVADLAVRNTKKGDRFALFQLEDASGSVKIVCWPETFKRSGRHAVAETGVLVVGRLERTDDGSMSIIADEVVPLDNLREREARSIVIHLPTATLTEEKVRALYDLLDRHRGECDVQLALELSDGSVARVQPNTFIRVALTPELTERLRQLCPDSRVKINVSRRLMTPIQREAAAPWKR